MKPKKINVNKSNDIGKIGEDVSCKYLEKHGYTIFSRNFKERYGEIDIIAIKDDKFYFAEVKSSSYKGKTEYNTFERVNKNKMRRILKTIEIFMDKKGIFGIEWYFVILAVAVDFDNRIGKVKMISNPLEF